MAKARGWSGLEGLDLAKEVSSTQSWQWDEGPWKLGEGYGPGKLPADAPHVVAIDYGIKRAILRQLVDAGARVTHVEPSSVEYLRLVMAEPPSEPSVKLTWTAPVSSAMALEEIQAAGGVVTRSS